MKNILLVGYGRMGKMHHEGLNAVSGLSVKYVVDHLVGDHVHPLSDLESLLQSEAVDGVVIATSSDAHVEMIELCSRYHKKIFCEKPISYDIQALKALQNTLKQRGADVQVGLNRRFDPHFSELQKRIQAGDVGLPQLVKITNRDPQRPDLAFAKRSGGLIYDFVIHDLDMVHFLTDATVVDIAIVSGALIDPRLQDFDDIDTALISLKLNNGALVAIDVSRESSIGYDQRIEVLGEKGMLKVENQVPTTLSHLYSQGRMQDLPHYSFVERYQTAYQNQFQAYAAWLAGERNSPQVGLKQMVDAVALADKIVAHLRASD